MDNHSEIFNKETENIRKYQTKVTDMKNTITELKNTLEGFPGGAVVESLPADSGDTGSSPGPGRSHMPRSN